MIWPSDRLLAQYPSLSLSSPVKPSYFLALLASSARSSLRRNSGSCPMGSMIGRHLFAIETASAAGSRAKWIKHETPVVPALWAPARQWTKTLSPLEMASSMKSNIGWVKSTLFTKRLLAQNFHAHDYIMAYQSHWRLLSWHTGANDLSEKVHVID